MVVQGMSNRQIAKESYLSERTIEHNNTTDNNTPSCSPDGKGIAYVGSDDEIYTIDTSGGTPFKVTNTITQDWYPSYPQSSKPPDTQAPMVDSVLPEEGVTRVAPGVNVTATFSEEMDASSINGTTFNLFKTSDTTTTIAAVVSYEPTTNKATLNPNANLKRGAKYKKVVTMGVKDVADNRLEQDSVTQDFQPKQWVFTVRR